MPPFRIVYILEATMATKRRGELEEELMTEANIRRVIKLLNPDEGVKPCTKKEACQILGMAYNTTRLDKIIQEFHNREALDKKRRAERRGKAATPEEVTYTIQEYLGGETIDAISKSLYRSSQFVKAILEKHDVPIRQPAHDYFNPGLIPDGAVRERFKPGEVVYSARYDSTARIDLEYENSPKHGWVYRIWLLAERWQQCAYQPASELASLDHLREIGVRV
jgi:hypothetical protein